MIQSLEQCITTSHDKERSSDLHHLGFLHLSPVSVCWSQKTLLRCDPDHYHHHVFISDIEIMKIIHELFQFQLSYAAQFEFNYFQLSNDVSFHFIYSCEVNFNYNYSFSYE